MKCPKCNQPMYRTPNGYGICLGHPAKCSMGRLVGWKGGKRDTGKRDSRAEAQQWKMALPIAKHKFSLDLRPHGERGSVAIWKIRGDDQPYRFEGLDVGKRDDLQKYVTGGYILARWFSHETKHGAEVWRTVLLRPAPISGDDARERAKNCGWKWEDR